MSRDKEIDAGLEFDRVEGERGGARLSEQRKPSPPGAKLFLVVVLAAVLGAGGFVTWKAMSVMKATGHTEAEQPVSPAGINRAGADWQPRPVVQAPEPEPEPIAPPEPQPVQPEVQRQEQAQNQGPSPEDMIRMRRLSSGLNNNSASQQSQTQAQAQPVAQSAGGSSGSPLANSLQPVRLNGSRAAVLSNRDMLLTQGSMIDCQLETRIVSTVPGMTTCYTTRDTYSTNGRVVLLDRGSKVVGQYQGGMTQGEARIFVLWTRVETPQGVIINLDSPGAGPLGEGGLGGWVDTHFWKRFGGAIMLSLIGDIGNYVSNQASRGSRDTITFENTADGAENMAAEALRNSINIPPTLYKNQGERLQIFVARDLDFSEVYSLEPSN